MEQVKEIRRPIYFENINFKWPKKEDLPQQYTKNIQAGNYCIKSFETGRVTLSKEKILDLKKIAPDPVFFTSTDLDHSAENIDFTSQTDTADKTDVSCPLEVVWNGVA